jgi:hypothetical protein
MVVARRTSSCTVDAGSVVAAETPEVARGMVIVPEISDTRLLQTLVLLERDRRLYVWVGGGRWCSAQGRRRGGVVVACAREYAARVRTPDS